MDNKPTFREYAIRDLKDFGIGHLTGESCAIGLRILYDLTGRGVARIEDALCIRLADSSPSNWNSKVGNIKAVKSIKLSHDQAYHVLVCILVMEYDVVLEFTPKPDAPENCIRLNSFLMAGNQEGYNNYRETLAYNGFLNDNYWVRVYQVPSQDVHPSTGLDNLHAFSGRTV